MKQHPNRERARRLGTEVSRAHMRGGCIVPFRVGLERAGTLVSAEPLVTIGGRLITSKDVSRILWRIRNSRWLARENSVLWTAYNSEDETSVIGVGAIVPDPVGARLLRMFPGAFEAVSLAETEAGTPVEAS